METLIYAGQSREFAQLLAEPAERQQELGYGHTLREIVQQPLTWEATAATAAQAAPMLQSLLADVKAVVLTGSGSSEYAGLCLQAALRRDLGITVDTTGGGELLLHGLSALPPTRPLVLISLARSGDSPESTAAVDTILQADPDIHHLVLTCNQFGRLANDYRGRPQVERLVLDDRTCDRSLVMTSSFTNMVVAGRVLGWLDRLPEYRAGIRALSSAAHELLNQQVDSLAAAAREPFRRAVYLGSDVRFGAAREAALKMLEMTAGRIPTIAETFLGVRHGPLCAIHEDTLVVCFLSPEPLLRAYEEDLIRELHTKRLGRRLILAGHGVDPTLASPNDLVVDYNMTAAPLAPVLDVIVGQLLAFFRCRAEGLQPDAPSRDGVINRVVSGFAIHGRPDGRVAGERP